MKSKTLSSWIGFLVVGTRPWCLFNCPVVKFFWKEICFASKLRHIVIRSCSSIFLVYFNPWAYLVFHLQSKKKNACAHSLALPLYAAILLLLCVCFSKDSDKFNLHSTYSHLTCHPCSCYSKLILPVSGLFCKGICGQICTYLASAPVIVLECL